MMHMIPTKERIMLMTLKEVAENALKGTVACLEISYLSRVLRCGIVGFWRIVYVYMCVIFLGSLEFRRCSSP